MDRSRICRGGSFHPIFSRQGRQLGIDMQLLFKKKKTPLNEVLGRSFALQAKLINTEDDFSLEQYRRRSFFDGVAVPRIKFSQHSGPIFFWKNYETKTFCHSRQKPELAPLLLSLRLSEK